MKRLLLVLLFALPLMGQYSPMPIPKQQFFDNNGHVCSGCKIYSYGAGTSAGLATYRDSSGTPNPNPVVLDASGRANIWLGSAYYKIVLADASGVVIWTADNVSGGSGSGISLRAGALSDRPTTCISGSIYIASDTVPANAQYICNVTGTSWGTIGDPNALHKSGDESATGTKTFESLAVTKTVQAQNLPVNVKTYGTDTAAFAAALAATPSGGTLLVPRGTYNLSGYGTELILIDHPVKFECEGAWGDTKLVVAADVPNTTDVIRVHGLDMKGTQIVGCQIVAASGIPARYGINLDATSISNGDHAIYQFLIERNWIWQLGGSRAITTTFNLMDGVYNGTFKANVLWGGIDLTNAGDNIKIDHNQILGSGPGIYADLVSGAIGPWITNNTFTACSGSVVIAHANSPKILYNEIEPLAVCPKELYNASIDIQGSLGNPVASPIVEGNTFSTAAGLETYSVRFDLTTNGHISNNISYAHDASQVLMVLTGNARGTTLGTNEIRSPGTLLSDSNSAEPDIDLADYGSGSIAIPGSFGSYHATVSGTSKAADDNQIFKLSSGDLSSAFQLLFSRSAAGAGAYFLIQSVENDVGYRDLKLNPSGGNVKIGDGSQTVYRCSGGTYDGFFAWKNTVCTGGSATATSLQVN